MNLPAPEQEKLRTERAIQGADPIWERHLEPKQTTPRPPECGMDKVAIELEQAGISQMLNTTGK